MAPRESIDTARIFLYVTGALLLLIAAYRIYLLKFRKGVLEAMNNVRFVTSRYDRYSARTQFMIDLPKPSAVELTLLDASESRISDLLNGPMEAGQHTIMFDPSDFNNGIYYLSLRTDNASILRKITIENPS